MASEAFLLSGVGGVETLDGSRAVVRLRRGADVAHPEVVHELPDERRTFPAHEWLAALGLIAAGAPVEAPVAGGVDYGRGRDAGFREAVASALPTGCGPAGEDPCLDEPHETVGEDVRSYALDRPGEQGPEVA